MLSKCIQIQILMNFNKIYPDTGLDTENIPRYFWYGYLFCPTLMFSLSTVVKWGSRSLVKLNDTIRFLDLKIIDLNTKTVILLTSLVHKL